jgi:UDP-N-acetylglucosamine kinase
MNEAEKQIYDKALAFAKKNKKAIVRKIASVEMYPPEADPVSVFMAGSPGAGKTEASKALLSRYGNNQSILRIDQDELRDYFEDYNGENSWLFQFSAAILVEKVHDLALDQCQSFILDGTFSNYEKAEKNIKRSLKKGRFVQIIYVYQNPELAWNFVQAREKIEGRRVLEDRFIEQYFAARNVVSQLKQAFKKDLVIDLLLKNTDGTDKVYKANIDIIDNYIPEKYTKVSLEKAITP